MTAEMDSEGERYMRMDVFDGIKHTLRKVEGIIEVMLLTLAYYLVWQYAYRNTVSPSYFGMGKYVLLGVYAVLMLLLFHYSDGFKYGHLKLMNVVISQWISIFIVNFITYFQLCLIANKMINAFPILVLTIVGGGIAFGCSYCFTAIYHRFYVPRKMLLIYGSPRALTLKTKMATRSDKYRIQEEIDADKGLAYICSRIPEFDAVVISDIPAQLRNDIIKYCYKIGKRTYVTPKISDIIVGGAEDIHLFDTPLYLIRARGLNFEERFWKRTMDIACCLLALAVSWPFMIAIAIAIKAEDGGPVFYKQRRCTRDNREFNILKFRSMIVNAEKDGRSIPAVDHDPRITRVGRVIRALRVDELPQIFNILSGKMSIVGPRPERIEHVQKYTQEIPEFAFRAKVKGGLTGYAQVYGKYNTTAYDKLKLDLMYIEHYSFMLDCKLILMTVATMFKKESTEGFDKQVEVAEKSTESTEAKQIAS